MSENKKQPKKDEAKKAEEKKPAVTVADFKEHIKDTELKLIPLKGTNAVKYDRNICYVRNAGYGVSVWVAVGKEANKTKQIETAEQLSAFVDSLKKYIEKAKEDAKKEK